MFAMALTTWGKASADPGSLPNGATLVFDTLSIKENGEDYKKPSNRAAQDHYFNYAHCACSKAGMGKETTFEYRLTLSKATGLHVPAEFWVGSSCEDSAARADSSKCRQLDAPSSEDIDSAAPDGIQLEFSLYDVIAGPNQGQPCPEDETDKPVVLHVHTDGMNGTDYSVIQNVGRSKDDLPVGVDTKPPPLPTNIAAEPDEGGIVLSWTPPDSRYSDISYYQALCATPDGTAVTNTPPPARYQTTTALCGLPNTASLVPSGTEASDVDAGTALPRLAVDLNPQFICGEASGAEDGMHIGGLENGVPYNVVLLAVDLHGNYAGTYFTSAITPQLASDFWDDLHDRGSQVKGGFCLLAETYGNDSHLTNMLRAFRDDTLSASVIGRWLSRAYYATLAKLGRYVHGTVGLRIVAAIALAPIVVLALVWHWLTLPGILGLLAAAWLWRRHAGRLVHLGRMQPGRLMRIGAGVAVIALGANRASADEARPYWENPAVVDHDQQATENSTPVTWHMGIRGGPYVPDIDRQLGMNPGPYQQTYGGYRILPMLDVDRIVWRRLGQVGVGVALGYMQKSAHSFVYGTDPADPDRPRSGGGVNTFRLLPMALTASYRMTWLDDKYRIPIVPYIRGGLSYYMWWISAKGDFVCRDEMASRCHGTDPRGASLGVQGSIGLAIRAERIGDEFDLGSMRESGIQHAGFYGELSMAKVDGFGSDTKLSVGDRTWFAGIDFEF